MAHAARPVDGPPRRLCRAAADSAELAGAAGGEFVHRLDGRVLLRQPFAGPLGPGALDFVAQSADGDAEHTLSALQEVDDLVGGCAFEDAGTIGHESDLGEILDAAGAQVIDSGANRLQPDAGVEESLDDLEHEDVTEAVETLAAGPGRVPDRRGHQIGARPVVEATIADADDLADSWTAIAGLFVENGQIIIEQQPLGC